MRPLLVTALLLTATAANADTIIELDIGAPLLSPSRAAFRNAAEEWERQLADDVTVRFKVGFLSFSEMGLPDNLGGTRVRRVLSGEFGRDFDIGDLIRSLYVNVRGALEADMTSLDDLFAVSSLPPRHRPACRYRWDYRQRRIAQQFVH